MFNFPLAQLLTASIVVAIIGISSYVVAPTISEPIASLHIEPTNGTVLVGDKFDVTLLISAHSPVNVFQGVLTFNAATLEIESINYNTSIADLWAEEPWYSNGAGTLNFIGGTTKPGGFTGEGTLITVTFKARQPGEARLAMKEIRILQHDGLGTLAQTTTPIDTIFTIDSVELTKRTVFETSLDDSNISVVTTVPSTDLNKDGTQSIADISVFMTDFITQNLRSDFNQDAEVNLKDLSILTKQ